ncbi:MAG: hypothetical protein IKJ92_00905, partial [Bacteroidaceae bacterium]|nr:hypothetical protein [Bacteroidaceae bacterium]
TCLYGKYFQRTLFQCIQEEQLKRYLSKADAKVDTFSLPTKSFTNFFQRNFPPLQQVSDLHPSQGKGKNAPLRDFDIHTWQKA